jgi:probable rRNA maturation factor
MAVQFFFQTKKVYLPNRKKLKSFLNFVFKKEKKKLKFITYIFCSDEYLLKINQDFLNHDYYTDIITFDMSDTKKLIKGEIYISVERVKENGKDRDVPFIKELYRVIFHGALHLCGYKDKGNLDIKEMRNKEDFYINLFLK